MKTNLSHVNNYNGLGRSFFTSNPINKNDILGKLRCHPRRGELLAHLVNFKMYRTSKNNDIEKQNSELTIIEDILNQSNSSITFDEAQHFVRNKSRMFQRQFPNHFKQAIIELTNSNNIVQCQQFINILVSGSKSFLETNGINISALITSNQEALSKKIAEYCTIIPYGYQYDSSKALEMLEKLGNKLEDNTCNALAIAIIKNCSGYDRNGYARNFSIALKLLEKFDGKLDRQVHNNLAINLIKYCSDINPNGNVRDVDRALEVLEKFGNQLEDNVRHSLVITLIENCSGIDSNGNVRDSYTALQALEKYGNQLDDNVRHSLMITLIKNCSSIDSTGKVTELSRALQELEIYGDQLEDNVRHSLVITLIENCSRIDSNGNLRVSHGALQALEKFGNQLEDNVRHSLVITLIANCSSIDSNGKVLDSSIALQTLEKFGNQLEDNIRHSLAITLIENCSGIDSNGKLRNPTTALQALEKYGNQLADNIHHSLVKALIENCSNISHIDNAPHARTALIMLNQNKIWLSEGENNRFYRQAVGNLFDSYISFLPERKLTQLLETHGEAISTAAILNKYRQTDSIRVVQAIRAYVQGAGRDRRINLPPRLDMQVNGRPLAGIAFEVHNFTDGIESAALKAIDEFLTALKLPKPKFIIDDLVKKFNLIKNEQLRNKANNALNRLLGSENYKEKLELALPTIAAFLNLHHTTWETGYHDANIYWNTLPNDEKVNLALKNHYNDPGSYWQDLTNDKNGNKKIEFSREVRWCMWLKQSFIEAGTAYDSGTDSTSCVKGVYERLFTGFRGMHPLIDCLFVTQTVTKGFNNGIKNWLKDTGRADDIVVGLKAKGLTGTEDEEFFKSELKQTYFQAIKKEIKRLIGEGLETCFNKLTEFKSLSSYLAEEIKGRKSQTIKDALDKFNVILDYLEAIEVDDEQTLDEYIKHQLGASHQSFLKSLPPLVDE
jgi:hypothetical protein